jgi:hypothetical protein
MKQLLRFGVFRNSLKNFLKNSEIFLKKIQNLALSVWVEAGELESMNMLYYECLKA